MRRAHAADESVVTPIPAQRHPCPSQPADRVSWPQVWAALERARAHYDPAVLDAAEKAALEAYRSTAQTFAQSAASAYGLHQQQAAALAELALIKAIRQCRAWDIRGFDLYVQAAVESELRNAKPVVHGLAARPPGNR